MAAAMMTPMAVKPFSAARVAVRPAQQRCLRLAVAASSQKSSPLQTAISSLRAVQLSAAVKPAATAFVANVLLALPAAAEPGKIFDFNLTLPIMVTEFLLLMVFLDKTWFGPVGKQLEDRDAYLREKLSSVKGDSGELQRLQEEAERVVSEARKEAQAMIAEAKAATQEEQNKKLAEVKARIDKELQQALDTLEKEKDAALQDLDAQVNKLSAEIMDQVLPEGIKLD
jgi:F-type H+-transporting ATPase subunit b